MIQLATGTIKYTSQNYNYASLLTIIIMLLIAILVWLIKIHKKIETTEQRYYDEERRHQEILQAIRESGKKSEKE